MNYLSFVKIPMSSVSRPWLGLRFCLGLCLFGLCFYSGIVGPQRGYDIPKLLVKPIEYAGREIKLSYIKVVQVLPGEFRVRQREATISVRVPGNLEKKWEIWRKELQVGDDVSLRALFHQEKYLLLQDFHVHKGRRLKIWVSVFGLILLAGILINEQGQIALRHA